MQTPNLETYRDGSTRVSSLLWTATGTRSLSWPLQASSSWQRTFVILTFTGIARVIYRVMNSVMSRVMDNKSIGLHAALSLNA